ncbi:hypothetical protein KJ059_06185 [Myxococcota bacterium]|nr:hypothetical protein [Myxococcota bacterium]MCZ7616995.1 hypothetical protein [Myxococcota bacterium]
MIHYLTSAAKRAPIELYLKDWGARLRRRVRVIAYEELPPSKALADGAFVFADVDRLSAERTAAAAALWDALAERGERVRLLNRPGVARRRADLLDALHRAGSNRFGVRRATGSLAGVRFPVFVRHALEHEGAYTPLLGDAATLGAALGALASDGRDPEQLLVVEFLDTAGPDGLFRKYAATVVGDRVIAHHVMFGRDWEVKGPSLAEPAMLAEERAFQLGNPHEEALRAVFRLAHIEYGRIDYAVLDGGMQVWEINTNPTLLYSPRRYTPAQLPAKHWFVEQFDAALLALDPVGARRRRWIPRMLRA